MDRDTALELLRGQHEFPGPFQFRVVVRPPDVSSTVTAMVAAAGIGARTMDIEERRSSKGSYTALHVTLEVEAAERVLDVYRVLGDLPHVLAKM